MKTTPAPHPAVRKAEVPRGWRKLRVGQLRKRGDRHFMAKHPNRHWHPVVTKWGPISKADMDIRGPYIRRLPPRKQKGRK